MKIKEKLYEAFRLYFILVTLISVLIMILGLWLDSDRVLGYDVFISPLFFAAVCIIPVFFFGNDKEISMKRLLLKNALTLVFVEAVVLIIAFNSKSIPTERRSVVLALAVGITVIYILTIVIEYIFELNESKLLNEALDKYQKTYDE